MCIRDRFIIFMITTSSYAASNSTYETDLKKVLTDLTKCRGTVSILSDEKQKAESSLRQVNEEIRDLTGKNQKLKQDNTDLEKKIEDQGPKIKSLREQNDTQTTEFNQLTKDVEDLRKQKTDKENEDKKMKDELAKVEKELAEKTEEQEMWTTGGTIAGGVNVLSLLSTGYFRWQLNVAQTEADAEEYKNRNLKGKLRNTNNTIESTKIAIKRSKEQIIKVNETINKCNQKLPEEKKVVENCLREEMKLHERAGILYDLGVDQAIHHHLSRLSNKHLKAETVYNSTLDGFNETLLKERTAKVSPLLVVILSSENYAFGAYFNITFEHTGSNVFKNDSLAFTFSTMQHAVCKIKTPTDAIHFSEAHFLEIGRGEIQIDKGSGVTVTGSATAGETYDCGRISSPHTFYAERPNFDVREIIIYHLQESHL
eukprot:TRINITY_DN1489_c0_g1_i3.p1 TRINITY_DN1489_c0_g1~~TRINITY_DN1489_c0_g1_i3.p1  ORF type:complete len:442 (+),score=126.42 TRINITY_DN1489_c0_g1_i3:48-1328(+)